MDASAADPVLLDSSTEAQRSNFEANYPDGSVASSGGATASDRAPGTDVQDLPRAQTYGPAPARSEILPPEADPTARDHPADGEPLPASLVTGTDNQELLRHYSSPAEYEAWRRRAARALGGAEPQSPAPPESTRQ